MKIVRVAVVQDSPVVFDRAATVDKTKKLLEAERLAQEGA